MPIEDEDPDLPELGVNPEKVCRIIAKARQFDVKEENSDPDSGSNPSDDDEADVLEDVASDPVRHELISYIAGLDYDEQVNLVALAWLGRGTYDMSDWGEALQTAKDEHNNRTAHYLLSLPLLGDYLEEGLAAFGESCADYEDET